MGQLFVAYYRVSTDRQGRSGLGLDAQRTAVAAPDVAEADCPKMCMSTLSSWMNQKLCTGRNT